MRALNPHGELFKALWNFALFKTRLRRQKAKARPAPISTVNVWCQLRQGALIGFFARHMEHLGEPLSMSTRTLRRHMAAFQAKGMVAIVQETYYDKKRREFVMRPNIYTIQPVGKRWVKKNVDATKFPLVV